MFDSKMLDVANWVACLNRENGHRGTPSHEALSVSLKGVDIHPKDHSIQLFTDASNERLGRSLRAGLYKGFVVRQGKKATHK